MGKKAAASVCVDEQVRIAVQLSIERFLQNDEQELDFPSSFSSTERAYVHRLCSQRGLVSKSKGKGINRHITIRRKLKGDIPDTATVFEFGQNSSRVLHSLLHRWPVKLKEKLDLQPRTAKQQQGMPQESLGFRPDASKTSGRLNNGIPQVPVKRGRSDLDAFRKTLPVANMADGLVSAIDKNPVVLICGETGSGKTTQIPQYILDECHAKGEPCRVLCAQPRRISAVAMAERVAAERGECVGHTVGYQIRLESRVSPRTLLTFCTNGVLLRTLMAGDHSLSTVTHVIVDEVHERDRFCDFLLTKLRQLTRSHRSSRTSPRHSRFRLIMMSAALDVELFVKYFTDCPVVNIPGKMYNVKEYFLENVLNMTGYRPGKASKGKELGSSSSGKALVFGGNEAQSGQNSDSEKKKEMAVDQLGVMDAGIQDSPGDESWKNDAMDQALYTLWHQASEKYFGSDEDNIPPSAIPQIFHLIQSENVSVNYRHSETGITALMASAMHGAVEECETLVSLGADATLKAANDWTAADMAFHLGHEDLAELLGSVIDEQALHKQELACNKGPDEVTSGGVQEKVEAMSEEDTQLVLNYQQGFDDERVDTDLIMKLLSVICSENEKGAILVFLPGYDDIVTLREMILSEPYLSDLGNINLFILHSSMQPSNDQKMVFKTPPNGARKIILSTNIAETSLTIDDVVYVVDAGKEKIKIYEALTSASALKSVWISKASALQRKGRAGRCRPGICFHLFSKARYEAMSMFQTAEILRTPLHELCLQAKLLATTPKKRRSRGDAHSEADEGKVEADSIADFLSRAPEPPSRMMLDNAVNLLKTIDALDDFEDLTELGHHLVDLPIEPRLGKMVLYSVVLKCLDPVLTIACALAYKDPFQIPVAPDGKRQARNCRTKFAAGAFSDHMCLLRAFQAWQKAKSDGWERAFCDKNYLSSATMQMIIGMRTQLLGQLRAAGFVRARGGSDIRDLNTNSENWAVVKAAICASAYPSVLRFDRDTLQLRSEQHKKVRFHFSSVLAQNISGKKTTQGDALLALPTSWVVYDELTMTTGHFKSLATARCCTAISPACISLFSGPAHLSQSGAIIEPDRNNQADPYPLDSDSEAEDKQGNQYSTLLITDWIRLKMDPQLCEMILDLRVKWYSLFLRRIRAPAKPWLPEDEAVLGTIINILSSEDRAHNLLQPSGIGQRPRPMSQEDNKCQRGFSGVRVKGATTEIMNLSRSKMVRTPNSQSGKVTPGLLSISSQRDGGSSESSPCFSPQPTFENPRSPSPKALLPQISYVGVVCNSQKNVQISQRNGIWLTTSTEEKVLSAAFQTSTKVILFIFLQDVYFAQGYARLSSPGAMFSNSAESQNLGWEKDSTQPDVPLTSYFSVEWIKKSCRLIESPPKSSSETAVWDLDNSEGVKLLNQWDSDATAHIQNSLLHQPPTSFQGSYPSYNFPGLSPANMFNPYHQAMSSPSIPVSSPLNSLNQRMPAPCYNPYQYAQQQHYNQQFYSQAGGMMPMPGVPGQCNYLRPNK